MKEVRILRCEVQGLIEDGTTLSMTSRASKVDDEEQTIGQLMDHAVLGGFSDLASNALPMQLAHVVDCRDSVFDHLMPPHP